jgi:hypothetical protein
LYKQEAGGVPQNKVDEVYDRFNKRYEAHLETLFKEIELDEKTVAIKNLQYEVI